MMRPPAVCPVSSCGQLATPTTTHHAGDHCDNLNGDGGGDDGDGGGDDGDGVNWIFVKVRDFVHLRLPWPIPDICPKYHKWNMWRKICHVEKFQNYI